MQKPSAGTLIKPGHPDIQGLIANWPFNTGFGGKLYDYAPTKPWLDHNHGTLFGPTWVSGRDGWTLSFNGTSDYITLPQLFTSPTELTWGMWFKSDVADTTEQRLLAYNNDGIYIIISINAGTANLIRVFCYANSGGGWSSSTTAYDVTQWHLIVGTAKENDYLRLCVDGDEIGSPVSLTTFKDTGSSFSRFIGSSRPVQSNWANGQVNGVFFYNRALSAIELGRFHVNPYNMFEYVISPGIFGELVVPVEVELGAMVQSIGFSPLQTYQPGVNR